jgi:DNA-binding beta-propeller fold protein YncE
MWVAVDQQGHVYVAGDRDIVKMSPSGKALATWDRKGTRGAWDLSGGVAVAPGGPVYAVSASGRLVQAFTPDGRVVREWGTRKGSPGRLIGPLGVSVAPNRMVVVADERAGRIVTFSPSGRLLRQWGRQCRQGTKGCPWYSGPFHAPTDVAVDRRGNIYVADGVEGGGSRVIKLSPSGRRLWQRNLLSPVGIAVDRKGNAYVTLFDHNYILKLSPSGATLARWSIGTEPGPALFPTGIAVDRKGTIYVAELGLGRVVKLSGGRSVATWQ